MSEEKEVEITFQYAKVEIQAAAIQAAAIIVAAAINSSPSQTERVTEMMLKKKSRPQQIAKLAREILRELR